MEGWRSQCRCYVIPILKTDEEFWAWDGCGEAPTESVNTVRDLPRGFRNYVAKNNKGIKEAVQRGTAPYWVRDNYHTLNPKRIKTDTEKIAIQTKWNERKTNNKINSLLDEYKIPHTNQNVYQAGAQEYHEIISAEKVKNAKGWMVDVHDQYDGCKCFLTGDKCSGIVVTADGDIASLFSSVRGDHRMEKLIMIAIENGGVKCDCYGGGLQNLYARFGATAVGRTPFNRAFAPPDWDGSSKFPIVAMIFPRSIQEAARLFNGKAEIDMRYVKIFTGENGYLDLLKYRDKLLK